MVGSKGVYEALKKLFVTDKDGHIAVDDLTKWGGTPLTGRDTSLDLANLDETLSQLGKDVGLGYQTRTTLGFAALGYVATVTAGAYCYFRLSNPNASGKTLYVHKVLVASQLSASPYTPEPYELDLYNGGTDAANPATFTSISTDIGSAGAAIGVLTGKAGAAATDGTKFGTVVSQGNSTEIEKSSPFIKVRANSALLFYVVNLHSANCTLFITVFWSEE